MFADETPARPGSAVVRAATVQPAFKQCSAAGLAGGPAHLITATQHNVIKIISNKPDRAENGRDRLAAGRSYQTVWWRDSTGPGDIATAAQRLCLLTDH